MKYIEILNLSEPEVRIKVWKEIELGLRSSLNKTWSYGYYISTDIGRYTVNILMDRIRNCVNMQGWGQWLLCLQYNISTCLHHRDCPICASKGIYGERMPR